MSTPSQVLPHTGLGAVTWTDDDGKVQIRLYFQDVNLRIRESRYNGTSWSSGIITNTFKGAKPAKPNTAIAAFTHLQDIHLFYLSTDNIIQEICAARSANDWAGGLVGPLSDCNIKACPLSRLAVLPYWTAKIDCTVFYQNIDGAIGHLKRVDETEDGKYVTWKDVGAFGNDAIYGTGLAAVFPDPYDDSSKIRVYYQKAGNILADFGVEDAGSFLSGSLNHAGTATNTDIAAASNKLFYLGATNILTSGSYYTSRNEWKIGADHPDHRKVRPGSSVAITLEDKTDGLYRVYIQNSLDDILELSFEEPWIDGAITTVPTGNMS